MFSIVLQSLLLSLIGFGIVFPEVKRPEISIAFFTSLLETLHSMGRHPRLLAEVAAVVTETFGVLAEISSLNPLSLTARVGKEVRRKHVAHLRLYDFGDKS
jgi:hypothetical protein